MKTRFFLVHVKPEGAALIGPYMNPSLQIQAARWARDSLQDGETLLWLDVTDGMPSVGTFDPMWWEEVAKPN